MKEKLIEKLFRGECTQAELELLLDLIGTDPAQPSQEVLQRLWEESENIRMDDADIRDKVFLNVFEKIHDEGSVANSPQVSHHRRVVPIPWLRAIAAGFVILIVGLGFYFQSSPSQDVVQTNFGELRSIQFDDGSTMQLNANSRASYAGRWEEGEPREVELLGEAYFHVEKKPRTGQVFNVKTDHALVEVLGTVFNVHSTQDQTSVYLEEGSVRLKLFVLDSTILMHPGDFVTYDAKTNSVELKPGQPGKYHTSWKDGVLIFNDSPLGNVLQKIEQVYGVEFNLPDQKLSERIIAFPLPIDSLETALSILEKTLVDLRIDGDGDTFVIEKK